MFKVYAAYLTDDYNRVVLEPDDSSSSPDSDYINASYVDASIML